MVTVVASKPHAEGVLARLRTLQPDIQIGDGVRPANAVTAAVLHSLDGGALDGPAGDPYADVEWPFQVTCIGRHAEEARWVEDRVRTALQTVTVTGRTVWKVEEDGAFGGARRDDDTAEKLFYVTPRWRLHTTPA